MAHAAPTEEAVATAWRATGRFPREAVLAELLGRVLDRAGEMALADGWHQHAVRLAPEDTGIALRHLARLARRDPGSVRPAVRDAIRRLSEEEARENLELLRLAGCARFGRCRLEGERLRVWFHAPEEPDAAVSVTWETAAGPSRVHPRPGDPTGSGIRTLSLAWPPGARAVRVAWSSGDEPLEGGRIVLPDRSHHLPARPGRVLAPRRLPEARAPIDVVVPVHDSRESVRRCLESLAASAGASPFEIVVVDDASTGPALRRDLAALAEAGAIRLIVNARNQGFTASANRGMRLHPDRDVVLLNADTIVPPGWLDRLRAAAARAPDIATVTPLSNNAEIASLGGPFRPSPLPSERRVREIDRAAARVNRGVAVDLPTGVGFCLYVRRACLDEIGGLDVETFGRGYGEETDFCLRAARAGWRSVCAADVFVGHEGSTSFGREKAVLAEANMRRVAARHPRYWPLMDAFARVDPLGPARSRLQSAAIARARSGAVLAVGSPGWRRDARLRAFRLGCARAGRELFWLAAAPERAGATAVLARDGAGLPQEVAYSLPDDAPRLVRDMGRLAPETLHLHGLDHPSPLLDAVAALDLPLALHADAAERAAATGTAAALLARAKAVPGPEAHDAEPTRAVEERGRRRHIAVVAGAGTPPGFARLLGLARAAALRGRPAFRVLEATLDDAAPIRSGAARVPGEADAAARPALARALGCGLALVLAPPGASHPALVSLAAEVCPRIAVLGDGPAAEAAASCQGGRALPWALPDAAVLEALSEELE